MGPPLIWFEDLQKPEKKGTRRKFFYDGRILPSSTISHSHLPCKSSSWKPSSIVSSSNQSFHPKITTKFSLFILSWIFGVSMVKFVCLPAYPVWRCIFGQCSEFPLFCWYNLLVLCLIWSSLQAYVLRMKFLPKDASKVLALNQFLPYVALWRPTP